jgi:AcrR family transcriptional regulator
VTVARPQGHNGRPLDGSRRGRVRLTREAILDGCVQLVAAEGESFTLARLGEHLGVDATAVYRHYRDKDDLLRAVADRVLWSVTVELPDRGSEAGWRAVVTEICVRLRCVHLVHPTLAALARSGPPLEVNEFDLTERLLAELRSAGLTPTLAALAYHALIELAVGSAVLDAPLARLDPGERGRVYRRWQSAYRVLDPTRYPVSVDLAESLYAGSAEERFTFALERLLDGIAVAGTERLSAETR